MNNSGKIKKFVLFLVSVIVLFMLIRMCIIPPLKQTGNNFQMTKPTLSDDTKVKSLKDVTLYLDNSFSMKGYVDFASLGQDGKDAKASMIGTISNFFDKVYKTFNIEPVCQCGGKPYNRNEFLSGMSNFSIFSGQVTELDVMINDICSATSDSGVAVLATDLILSYGKPKLKDEKDTFFNRHHLEELGASVHKAMSNVKKKGFDVLVLQYYSDFNGKYYCNYTENLQPSQFGENKLMKNRPFYLIAIGKTEFLKGLSAYHCFNLR